MSKMALKVLNDLEDENSKLAALDEMARRVFQRLLDDADWDIFYKGNYPDEHALGEIINGD